jgi:hypothetical protein
MGKSILIRGNQWSSESEKVIPDPYNPLLLYLRFEYFNFASYDLFTSFIISNADQ